MGGGANRIPQRPFTLHYPPEGRFERYLPYIRGMILRVLVHKAEEGGYWAEIPALPGCYTQAETLEELDARAREAAEAYLQAGDDSGSDEFESVLKIAV